MFRALVIFSLLTTSTFAQDAKVKVTVDIEASIKKGVDFLVSRQNKNGSWGGPTRTKGLNIFAPVPDAHQAFKIASTSLALQGMLETRDQRPATLASIKKCEAWLLEVLPKHRNINRTATYNVWSHSYGLRALASLYRYHDDPIKRSEYKRQAAIQIAKLKYIEDVNSGWGYLDLDDQVTEKPTGKTMSFTTATAMLAMHDAAQTMQLDLPPVLIKRAIRTVQLQRNPDFTYAYSLGHRWAPRNKINRPAGSLGRSQVCNAALRKFGDKAVTDEVIRTWLQRLFDRQGWLDHGRKRPIPHEAPAAVSGYFYYYGHYYASECIHILPENERAPWKKKLAALMISKQETNGCWWDYPLYNYHYAYGTGYTLTILSRCR